MISFALNIATQGFLSTSPISIAVQGFYIPATVVIPPDPPPVDFHNGGSTVAGSIPYAYPYIDRNKIIVTTSYGNISWTAEMTEDEYDSSINAVAYIGRKPIYATALFLRSLINNENPTIKVKKL